MNEEHHSSGKDAFVESTTGGTGIVKLDSTNPSWPGLADLFEKMYDEFLQYGLLIDLPKEGAQAWLRAVGTGHANLIFAAIESGAAVGFVHAIRKFLPLYLGGGLVGEIVHLYVVPAARRKGLGQKLAEHAVNHLKEGGVSSVEIKVLSGNVSALEFWQSIGFGPELQQMRLFVKK